MINLFNYIDRQSPVHKMTGATKLICLLLWSFASMVSFDTRVLAAMAVSSVLFFAVSKIKLKDVSFMLWFTFVFLILNNLLVFLFSPQHGCEIYGSCHELFSLGGRYVVTSEQLFYHLNLLLKYLAAIPVVLLFLCTTNPSEFAASLNRIGVSYKIAYSVALALRYIPDIQKEYYDISRSQQARGIEMSKKESLIKRLKSASSILVPLVLSSMERIDIISNAMELRGFGKERTRTWYMGHRFEKGDYIAIAVCALVLALVLFLRIKAGSRFFNPFL